MSKSHAKFHLQTYTVIHKNHPYHLAFKEVASQIYS